jgi:hypothetical protein
MGQVGVNLNTGQVGVRLKTGQVGVSLKTGQVDIGQNTGNVGVNLKTGQIGINLKTGQVGVNLKTRQVGVILKMGQVIDLKAVRTYAHKYLFYLVELSLWRLGQVSVKSVVRLRIWGIILFYDCANWWYHEIVPTPVSLKMGFFVNGRLKTR